MIQRLFINSRGQIRAGIRGHLLQFDTPVPCTWSGSTGIRVLLAVVLLEAAARPVLRKGALWLRTEEYVFYSVALGLSLLIAIWCATHFAARVRMADIGLKAWHSWSVVERSYFPQSIVLGFGMFYVFFTPDDVSMTLSIFVFSFAPQLLWGFLQEWMYRGLLQTELVRRFGPWLGLFAATVLFTFGPLHAYHFRIAADHGWSHLWIFAWIFGIGLVFGLIFLRSGNLWLVGVLHGIGDAFMQGMEPALG